MRIGVLNLPFDNNFGGNLQRFALIKALNNLGFEAEHINLRRSYLIPSYKKPFVYLYRILKKSIGKYNRPINKEVMALASYIRSNLLADDFYNRYVPHTNEVFNLKDIKSIYNKEHYSAIIVGSDQVWREDMTRKIGIENYFLKFLDDKSTKKIAYAVSTGNEKPFSDSLLPKLGKLYEKFDSVSVREDKALDLLKEYGWNHPEAKHVVDPTMLLEKNDYLSLIVQEKTFNSTTNKIFCYMLDMDADKQKLVNSQSERLGFSISYCDISESNDLSIPQWLANIYNCSLMITDSFHGVVFSIIFNKPFLYLGNERRGNLRISSLFNMLKIDKNSTLNLDWYTINRLLAERRSESLEFLIKSLT